MQITERDMISVRVVVQRWETKMRNNIVRFKELVYGCAPEHLKNGDWMDLRNAWATQLKAGEYALLSLGIAVELPKGYEALVVPRSSTFKWFGIIQTNGIGVIDESYCGDDDEWHMPVYATRDVVIPEFARIAQFRIIKHQPNFELVKCEILNNKSRGGVGSTGVF